MGFWEDCEKHYPLITREYPSCGVHAPQGWQPLIMRALGEIEELMTPDSTFVIDQIKEKFGRLRIYYSPQDERIAAIVEAAEQRASKTCVVCGNKTNNRPRFSPRCEGC